MSEPLHARHASDIRSPGNVGTAARHLHFRRPATAECRNRCTSPTLPTSEAPGMSEPLHARHASDIRSPGNVGTAEHALHFRRPAALPCRNRRAPATLPTPSNRRMSEPLHVTYTSDARQPQNVGTAARHLRFRHPKPRECRNRRAPATLSPGGSCFLCEGLSEGCRSSSKSGQTRAKNDALPSEFVPRLYSINWQRKEPKHQLIARQVSGICQLPAETCFTDSAIIECPWS